MHRLADFLAMVMIGDGALALLAPREHVLVWSGGPRGWNRMIDACARHPNVTRALAAAELAGGLLLA
ncbi:MAG: hypothetical protein AB1716_10750 [Planctomycetota bacterium]